MFERARSTRRSPTAVLAISVTFVLVAGCGRTATAPAVSAARADRAAALAAASELLGETRPPQAAVVNSLSGLPKEDRYNFDHPFGWLQIAPAVDRFQLWQTSASPVTAAESAVRDLPRGTKLLQSASGGTEFLADYRLPAGDQRALGTREVSVTADGDSTGTMVRVDAEVAYFAPRTPGERVPSAARVLDITVGSNLRHPLMSLKLTSLRQIRQIAAIVNGLPFNADEQGIAYSCPPQLTNTPVDRFVFRGSVTGPSLATVTESATTPTTVDPCVTTTLVIGSGPKRELQNGGQLLRRAAALLHVRLRVAFRDAGTGARFH